MNSKAKKNMFIVRAHCPRLLIFAVRSQVEDSICPQKSKKVLPYIKIFQGTSYCSAQHQPGERDLECTFYIK